MGPVMGVNPLIPETSESFIQKVARTGYLNSGLVAARKPSPDRTRHRTICEDQAWRDPPREPAMSRGYISPHNLRYHSLMNKRRFLQITKALVDSRRFDILERIAATKDEISCIDLRAEIPISRATLSHHIKELATAGLIDIRRKSKYMFLRMRQKTWREYVKRLSRIAP